MNYGRKGVRDKQKALHSKTVKFEKKIAFTVFMAFLIGIISLGIIGAAAGIGVFNGIISTAPVINSNDVAPVGFSTFVYDSEGNQIEKLVGTDSNRIFVTMDQIPENLANAFVAIEDERFYEHNGIDLKALLRSGYQFIKTGGKETQGGSTITQQLLKNTIFTNWVHEDSMIEKIERKFQEQYLAIEISKILSKEEILLRYMNTINLGQNTLGVEAASLRYFNKHASELTLSECAVIAGITQNPSKYNPISRPEKNAERRERVLNKMKELGYITAAEYDEALADDVYSRIQDVNIEIGQKEVSSYFIDALTKDVYADLIEAGYSATAASTLLYSGGLRIYSTLDSEIQKICDEEFADPDNFPIDTKWYLQYALTVKTAEGEYVNYSKEMLQTWYKKNVNKDFNLIFDSQEDAYDAVAEYKAAVLNETDVVIGEDISLVVQPQMSMTIMDQSTGYVVAMVGGRGTKEGSRTLNRATDSTRSPGSTFKILSTYAPALDSANLTLATVINDAPFAYDNGVQVRNWWKGGYRGINPLRTGIQNSMNVSTVKLLTWITPQLGFDYLKEFGFTTLDQSKDCFQAMALGGVTGVTNYEVNAAYATIANGGVYIEPKLYTKVLDSDGNVILDNTATNEHRVLKETTAFLLTSAMEDVVTKGTGTAVNFGGMAIAGKTGTASETKDVWFAGYTPYYTATVWAGYDNQAPLDESNSNPEKSLAKKLWRAVMARIHEDLPKQSFVVPAGIVQMQVCSKSGKLPVEGLCDVAGCVYTEYFDEDNVPTEYCDVHYNGNLCLYSMLIPCENCPFSFPSNGVVELPLIEDASLIDGSTIITENEDGTITTTAPYTTNMCPHNALFFSDPNAYSILEIQRQELEQRGYYFAPIYQPSYW